MDLFLYYSNVFLSVISVFRFPNWRKYKSVAYVIPTTLDFAKSGAFKMVSMAELNSVAIF